MNSLHNVGVLLVAAALIGAMGSTTSLLQNQASAQGVIVPEREEQFNKLSEQFQQDVSDIVSGDPPSEDNAGDPPTENRPVDPPDPDTMSETSCWNCSESLLNCSSRSGTITP